MRKRFFIAGATAGILAGILLLGAAGCLPAEESRGSVEVRSRDVDFRVVFTDRDRAHLRDYYHGGKSLPPGLAKKERLPPGLEKQLERRGTLPPGLEGRGLPPDLERRLSRLPEGYIRLRVGADIVLLHQATRVIVDLVTDLD